MFIVALLDPIIPKGYIHRLMRTILKQRNDKFEDAKASIDLVLSNHTSISENETEHRKKFYNIMMKIIGCEDIHIQIEAFTIALLAGTIGHGKPPVYTFTVAEEILEKSGIRKIPIQEMQLASSNVDPKTQLGNKKEVDGLATSIENHTQFDNVEKKVVSAALSLGEFVDVDVGEFVEIVFDPTRQKYRVPANRKKFVKTKGIMVDSEYLRKVVVPLCETDLSRLTRLIALLAVFLAESEKNKRKAVSEIINSAIASLIKNETFPPLVNSDEEISGFISGKILTKTNSETTEKR